MELSKYYEVKQQNQGFYTGGTLDYSQENNLIYSLCDGKISVFDLNLGKTIKVIEPGDNIDALICFALVPNSKLIIGASRNFLIRIWDRETDEIVRTWRAHDYPIISMACDESGRLLATGSTDRSARVWDILGGYCTHNYSNFNGNINYVKFNTKKLHLIVCSDEGLIKIYDLKTNNTVTTITEHLNSINIIIILESFILITGNDKIITILSPEYKILKTIIIYEEIMGMSVLKSDLTSFDVVIGGNEGILKLLSFENNQYKIVKQQSDKLNIQYIKIFYNTNKKEIIAFTNDFYLFIFSLDLEIINQFICYNHEIIDLKFYSKDTLIMVGNTEKIRIIDLISNGVKILSGHTESIFSCDTNGEYIITGSKDNTAKVWDMTKCIATLIGHTDSIGAVCIPKLANPQPVFTTSNDKTIKKFILPKKLAENPNVLAAKTIKAHDKDINGLSLSPNGKILASCSQDKLIKLWHSDTLVLIRVLKGHKKGVWNIQFSPIEKALLSCSGDKTIRIWSVEDGFCLMTLEGHTTSVLRAIYINNGLQVMSSSSDGLMKVWSIKENECLNTFDKHTDSVWAIAAYGDTVVSGGSDCCLNVWEDVTKQKLEEEYKQNEDYAQKNQQMKNYIYNRKFEKALILSLDLKQPSNCFSVLTQLIQCNIPLDFLKNATKEQITQLFDYLCQWNTRSRNVFIVQNILSFIFKNINCMDLFKEPKIKSSIEALIAYSERHYNRINNLLESSYLLDYSMLEMGQYEELKRKNSIFNFQIKKMKM